MSYNEYTLLIRSKVFFNNELCITPNLLAYYSTILIDDVCSCFSLQSGQSAIDEPLKISSSFLYSDLVTVSDPLHSFYGFQNQTGNGNDLNEFDENMAPSHELIGNEVDYGGLVNYTSVAFFIFFQRILST